MGRILKSIIVIVLCGAMFSAALLVPYRESETVDPQILEEADAAFLRCGIYLDGKLLYNWKLTNPVVSIDGKAYFPVSTAALDADEETERVGELVDNSISADPASASLLKASAGTDTTESGQEAALSMVTHKLIVSKKVDHKFKGFKVTTGYKELNGLLLGDPHDIAVTASGTVYASEDFFRNELGIDVLYSPGRGVYLSTDPDVSAADWAAVDTNADYEKALVKHMMNLNKYLNRKTAEWYVYLIIHVAAQYKNLTPTIIFSVAYTESHFFANAGTGAIGLMQILYKYAKKGGVTKEMLLDPHTNLELGSSQLNYNFNVFNGDAAKAFAAYNRGSSAVRANPNAGKGYANIIMSRLKKLEKLLIEEGIGTEYKEQLTLKKSSGN